MDDLDLASDALEKNLRELEIINTELGGYKVTLDALKKLRLDKNRHYKVIDIGSGAGDMLRKMADWAEIRGYSASFTGLDANQFMLDYASKRTVNYDNIEFNRLNVFDAQPQDLDGDIVTMNLFCHHFTDEELEEIISRISNSKVQVCIINDLHRHPLAYYSIWLLTRLFNGSYLVKNDAPLSVKRAFRKNEIQKVFRNSAFQNITIQWYWAFRWQLIASKSDDF